MSTIASPAISLHENQAVSLGCIELRQKAEELKSKLLYKVVRGGEKNHLAQRVGMEVLGVDLPTIVCEFFLRGWKSAAGAGLRISLFVVNSQIIPTAIIPGLNFIAKKAFGLPKEFKNLFYNQFEDLTPEKKNEKSNIEFLKKVEELEGKEVVETQFYDAEGNINHNTVYDFKEKMLKAKAFVMRWDIQIGGLLSYVVPWCQNWFEQGALKLIGFSGEDKFLEDSQKKESVEFHNKFKWVKFTLGLFPTVFGSHYYSKFVGDTINTSNQELKGNRISNSLKRFVKTHVKQFDYYKGIFANKLNLAGTLLAGADTGMILATRTIGEFCERLMRLGAFWPSFVYGIEWFHSRFAQNSDNKHNTQLIDTEEPAELGIKKVKTIDKLEKEFDMAINENDEKKAENVLKALENAPKSFGYAFAVNSGLLGVALNVISYIFMRIRIAKGIY